MRHACARARWLGACFSPYLYLDVIRFLAFLRTTIPERRAGGACPGRVWEARAAARSRRGGRHRQAPRVCAAQGAAASGLTWAPRDRGAPEARGHIHATWATCPWARPRAEQLQT